MLCLPLQVLHSDVFYPVSGIYPCTQGNLQPGNCVAVIRLALDLEVFSWGLLHAFKGREEK